MADLLRRRRKAAPRHALPAATRKGVRGADRTTLSLIIVLVLTSGFVAGTTATFNATTQNGGNTFTTASIDTPTNPIGSMSGSSGNIAWTNVNTALAYNANVGYRVLRKGVNGPSNTGGTAPSCTAGSYATLGYATGSPYADSTIPSAAADQGKYYCYAVEGVYPCCPATGLTPVLTSLSGRIEAPVQTGYVVQSWNFNSGNGDSKPTGAEKLVVNFNQPVNTASSITTSHRVCVDAINKLVRVGMTSGFATDCMVNAAYEAQTFTFSGNPTSGGFTLTWGAPINCSVTITEANTNSNATAQSTLQTALNASTCFGTGGTTVAATGCGTCVFTVTFAANNSFDIPTPTASDTFNGSNNVAVGGTAGSYEEAYELQRLTTSGTATTGTFTITWGAPISCTTSSIAYNATQAAAQTAVDTCLGTGNSRVFPPTLTCPATVACVWDVKFAGMWVGDMPTPTIGSNSVANGGTARTIAVTTPTAGTSTASLGYIFNNGTWSGSSARWSVSAVAWTNSNKTVTITLNANLGANVPTMATGQWTFIPTSASGKSPSSTGALALCTTDPTPGGVNAYTADSTAGLCRPTSSTGW
jgi:hypothetical protein